MAIVVSDPGGGGDFRPAPAGLHLAVCCDVVDLGMGTSTYQGKTRTVPLVRLVWQVEKSFQGDDGAYRPYVVTKRYTASLHDNANLRADLRRWRGVDFTEEERKGFDLEKLIGVACQLQIMHSQRGDKTYANVDTVLPAPKGAKLEVTPDYVRKKDREDEQQTQEYDDASQGPEPQWDDEPVPAAAYDDDPPF